MYAEYIPNAKQYSFVLIAETGQEYFYSLPDQQGSTENLDHAVTLALTFTEEGI